MTAGRSRLVAAAVLGATFLAGVVVGAAAYRYSGSAESTATAARGSDPAPSADDGRSGPARDRESRERGPTSAILEILREDVGISDRQEEEVRAVLERREERAREVFEGVRDRFHRWMDTTVARVSLVLDRDQAEEFERLLEERMEERRRERRGSGSADSAGAPPDTAGGER